MSSRRYHFAAGYLAVLGIVACFTALTVDQCGNPAGAKYAILFAAILFVTAYMGYVRTRPRRDATAFEHRPVGHGGTPCLTVPCSAVGWYGSLGTLLLLVALFAVGAFDATGGGRIALGGVAAALSGYFVLVALGRVARGRIERSPEGIYQRSWSFEVFLPWRGVVRLAPGARTVRRSTSSASATRRGTGAGSSTSAARTDR